MKEGLKCAAVFIGTVIGAGFATGQEVLLYFGRSSIAVPIFSGILLGLFNAYFWQSAQNLTIESMNICCRIRQKHFMMYVCSFVHISLL